MNYVLHSPEYLYLLLLLPILAWLLGRKGKRRALLFPNIEIAKAVASRQRRMWGALWVFLRMLPFALIIVALARPQIERGFSEENYSGVDIVLTVDLSPSMLALDFSQNEYNLKTRLDVVKEVLNEFIDERKNDRIGMIAFSRDPYLVSPLTLNHDWLKSNLARMEIGMAGDATAIGTAIASSTNRLRDSQAKSKIVILLTDGDNNAGDIDPNIAAESARAFGVKVYTVAIGRNDNVYTYILDTNTNRIARNRNGQPLIRETVYPVNFEALEKIAEITRSRAFQAKNVKELHDIYEEINRLEKTDIKIRRYANYEELFYYFLIPAIVLLLLGKVLRVTRYRRAP